jgi:hypothetical protein
MGHPWRSGLRPFELRSGQAFAGTDECVRPTRASLVREFVYIQPADRFLVLIGGADIDCAVHDGW